MSKQDLISNLSEEQLDNLLIYTPAFSEKNIANIKARSFEKIKIMEKPVVKKPIFRSFSAIAAACFALMIFATTAFAAWHFLRPSEVVDLAGDSVLSSAFESESAININQSIVTGNHIITLLSVVSGEEITNHPIYNSTGEILSDRTYAVLAIKNTDSSPMPMPTDANYRPFIVSPFIRGESPWRINAFTMDGGSTNMVFDDGVMYVIADFTNVTMFADRGVYLGVNTNVMTGDILNAFIYDEQTGEITASSDFRGSNAIFSLPLDASLADPERAEQFLDSLSIGAIDSASNATEKEMTNLVELPRLRMDYELLSAWSAERMEMYRSSGNYSLEAMALFEQDHANLFDAIIAGYHVYLVKMLDGQFATMIINPESGYEISINRETDDTENESNLTITIDN